MNRDVRQDVSGELIESARGAIASEAELEALRGAAAALARRSKLLSWLRLLSFLLLAAGCIAAIDSSWFLIYLTLPAAAGFVVAFVLHGRVLERETALGNELLILTEARQRARSRRRTRPAPRHASEPVPSEPVPSEPASPLAAGERIYAAEPASFPLAPQVADDLEVYEGPRSLFSFLDWTSTAFGARRLRRLLAQPLSGVAAIEARQAAVREIAARREIRDQILLGLLPLRQFDLGLLAGFFAAPPVFAGRKALFVLASVTGSLAPLCLVAMIVTGRLDFVAPLLGLILFNFVLIGFNVGRSNPVRDRLLLFGPLLSALERLEQVSSSAEWVSAEWRAIHSTLASVSGAVHSLIRYVRLLSLHSYGVIFEIINVLTVWELRILPRADAVFHRHRELLQKAAGALGEIEALTCLALPLAEQKDFSMPRPLDAESPLVEAESIGHPLIDSSVCVHNPVSLGQGHHVWILTGSNMSGKSTYLKSVGLNLVLAGIGSAVCGSGFRWTPLAIHTDVNIRDSLDDGKSYFQVEVERIRAALESAARSTHLIVLCDEMFRGTNSDERLAISRAVVRFLRDAGVLVLMATHDRQLTQLVTEDRLQGIANYHLRDDMKNGVMYFDYRLREGVTPTRNALRVLESQAYPEEIVREAREFLGEG